LDREAREHTLDYDGFYNAQQPRLLGALTLYTGDRELAMDLCQDALARAYRDWRKVSRMDSPAAWVFRVAFNLANSMFRRRIAEWRASSRLRARHDPTTGDADTGTAVAVRAAVASLPRRQRTALVLRYYADLPVDQVAEQMGCAAGTVRALTSQAITSLRSAGLTDEVEAEV
jgi:RNA polymerase sigma-70 factor (sigma-E family)